MKNEDLFNKETAQKDVTGEMHELPILGQRAKHTLRAPNRRRPLVMHRHCSPLLHHAVGLACVGRGRDSPETDTALHCFTRGPAFRNLTRQLCHTFMTPSGLSFFFSLFSFLEFQGMFFGRDLRPMHLNLQHTVAWMCAGPFSTFVTPTWLQRALGSNKMSNLSTNLVVSF